jgi:hypothetical protein
LKRDLCGSQERTAAFEKLKEENELMYKELNGHRASVKILKKKVTQLGGKVPDLNMETAKSGNSSQE